MNHVKQILAQSLYSSLSDADLEDIITPSTLRSFQTNTIIISEGDSTNSFYVVCSGNLKVSIIDRNGKEVILALLGPGDYFGEMAALLEEERSANVITREPSQLLIISRKVFMDSIRHHPEIAISLMKNSMQNVRKLTKKVEELSFLDVYGRIARLFSQMAEPSDDKSDDKMIIKEKLTHQDIANMVSSSREMVSRVLKELSNGNYIETHNKRITINKKLPFSW